MITKINLTTNQLLAADLFLGYHTSNWNPRINYFLIGKYKNSNIFNANHIYASTRKFISITSDLFAKKCSVWLVNEKFSSFKDSPQFSKLPVLFPEIKFMNEKWCKGVLSNYKHVRRIRPWRFPHSIFVPNMQNNHYVINECFIINIPSFGIADSVDDPTNVFFPIPGNSRSVRALFLFYLMVCKSVLYSRCLSSSSFIFSFYKKASKKVLNSKTNLKPLALNKFFDLFFWRGYSRVLTKSYLFKDFFVLAGEKIYDWSFLQKWKYADKSKKPYLIRWAFVFCIFTHVFLNLFKLYMYNLSKSKPLKSSTLGVLFRSVSGLIV
jgi:ribosomal protein S2